VLKGHLHCFPNILVRLLAVIRAEFDLVFQRLSIAVTNPNVAHRASQPQTRKTELGKWTKEGIKKKKVDMTWEP
jgi:hypothetical protein